MKYNFPCA